MTTVSEVGDNDLIGAKEQMQTSYGSKNLLLHVSLHTGNKLS